MIAGQAIGTMDVEKIKNAGKETATIVAITNTKKKLDRIEVTTGAAKAGAPVAQALCQSRSYGSSNRGG